MGMKEREFPRWLSNIISCTTSPCGCRGCNGEEQVGYFEIKVDGKYPQLGKEDSLVSVDAQSSSCDVHSDLAKFAASGYVEFQCTPAGSISFARVPNAPSVLVVKNISKSCCFSRSSNPGIGLGTGDVITEVYGVEKQATDMQEALQNARYRFENIRVYVKRRPAAFSVDIPRQGPEADSLGLIVSPDKVPNALWVAELKGAGLIPGWNRYNAYRMILHGDTIVEVNGISGNSEVMIEAIRNDEDGMLHLKIEQTPETEGLKSYQYSIASSRTSSATLN